MNTDVKKENVAKQALGLLMVLTALVVIYEMSTAIGRVVPGDNFFDFSFKAIQPVPYSFVLMLVLIGAFPFVYLLFKTNHISLKEAIYQKQYILSDIGVGLIGGILSALITLVFNLIHTHFANQTVDAAPLLSVTDYTLYYFSLVVVCGILKELYFRGLAKHFLKDVMGEKAAFMMTNILFGVLDWQNLGDSFLSGLIWGKMYQRRNRLIVPMVAHASVNFIALTYQALFM